MKPKVITILFLFALSVGAADPPDLYIAPYLQNVTPNSITVMWETKEAVIGKVVYGQNKKMNQTATETTPVKIHEIHLTGLQPNTTYDYQAQYGKEKLTPASLDHCLFSPSTLSLSPHPRHHRATLGMATHL